MKTIFVQLFAFTFIFASTSGVFAQGSLTPSAAPGPTMKTLAQIEPRTPISSLPFMITNAGSYFVTTNLTGIAGSSGITVAASSVTVDLMGFELVGVTNSLSGILVADIGSYLVVRNGTIRNWSHNGVNAGGQFSEVPGQFQDLRLFNNGSSGIIASSGASIRDCISQANGANGFWGFSDCRITDCVARRNGSIGIRVGIGSTVKNLIANRNAFAGIDVSDGPSTVIACTTFDNIGSGIRAGNGSKISDCTVTSNEGNGIET